MSDLLDKPLYATGGQLIIKPTSVCNFNCSFCSAKKLNIPLNHKVPQVLKDYILQQKPSDIILTGGEPLMNPRSYFEDLLEIMNSLNKPYNICLTSNLMLWYNNPEKYDWLFNHPNISVDTSFQYGSARRDNEVYSEERFRDLFFKFYERYNKKLDFISVISSENEQYAIKTVELAKELDVWVKLNCQIPVGLATEYYPRYKLLNIYLQLIKLGLDDHEGNLLNRKNHCCSFTKSYKICLLNKMVYVDKDGQLVKNHCEEVASSEGRIKIQNGALFPKCYGCKFFNLCNSCSVNRECTRAVKDEHCKWIKEHAEELIENDLV